MLYLTKVYGGYVSDLWVGVRIPVDPSIARLFSLYEVGQETAPIFVFLTQSLKQNQFGPVGFELQPRGPKRFHFRLRLDISGN
jgi:hypothetical protein